jgi:Tol biopolymer transport system component
VKGTGSNQSRAQVSHGNLSNVAIPGINLTNVTQLTNYSGFNGYPAVSSDGTKIVFQRDSTIAIMNKAAESASNKVTLLTSSVDASQPQFFGSDILYIAHTGTAVDDIYQVSADGTGNKAVISLAHESCFNWGWVVGWGEE